MVFVDKDNVIDGSCYVAVYEQRKLGGTRKKGYVLVDTTETITHEPKYFLLSGYAYHLVLASLSVLICMTRSRA